MLNRVASAPGRHTAGIPFSNRALGSRRPITLGAKYQVAGRAAAHDPSGVKLTLAEGRNTTKTVRSPPVGTNFFEVLGADDSDLLNESYRVRYQVYCLERGFLAVDDYPEHMESDPFDAHAIHLLARHKKGYTAGTARMVRHSPLGFPMQGHCVFDDAHGFLRPSSSAELDHYCEISRLAVSKLFRRRTTDNDYGGPPRYGADPEHADLQPVSPSTGPEIVTGIYKYIYHESKRLGITHWLVAMERSLDVMLRRMGLCFTPAGPEADYYGPVRPFVASVADIERSLAQRQPGVWAYMLDGLPDEYAATLPIWDLAEGGRRA